MAPSGYFSNIFIIHSPVAQWFKRWPTDLEVTGSSPARCGNLSNRKRGSIAHSLSLSPNHRPDMTEILLKGRYNHKSSILLVFSYRPNLEELYRQQFYCFSLLYTVIHVYMRPNHVNTQLQHTFKVAVTQCL